LPTERDEILRLALGLPEIDRLMLGMAIIRSVPQAKPGEGSDDFDFDAARMSGQSGVRDNVLTLILGDLDKPPGP